MSVQIVKLSPRNLRETKILIPQGMRCVLLDIDTSKSTKCGYVFLADAIQEMRKIVGKVRLVAGLGMQKGIEWHAIPDTIMVGTIDSAVISGKSELISMPNAPFTPKGKETGSSMARLLLAAQAKPDQESEIIFAKIVFEVRSETLVSLDGIRKGIESTIGSQEYYERFPMGEALICLDRTRMGDTQEDFITYDLLKGRHVKFIKQAQPQPCKSLTDYVELGAEIMAIGIKGAFVFDGNKLKRAEI